MNQDLADYYAKRAKEYDKVYLNPDEQPDLLKSARIFEDLFANRKVLEIACGTGYWTEVIARTAKSVYATDINESVLQIAKSRVSHAHVQFEVADMLHHIPEVKYEGLFGGFIWSHILLQDLELFLQHFSKCLLPGAVIAFIDSNPVKNTNHDPKNISQTDAFGNTFQRRGLEDGSQHLVLKNFPTPEFLERMLSPISCEIEYQALDNYWIVTARLY